MLTIWMKWFGPTAPTVSAGATPLIFEIPAKFGLAVENSGGVTPKAPTGAPAPSRNSSSGIPFGGGIGTTMSSGRGTPSPMGAKRVADGGVGPTSGRVARSRVKTLGVKGPPTVTSVIPGAGPCARAGFGGPSRQKRSASVINADTGPLRYFDAPCVPHISVPSPRGWRYSGAFATGTAGLMAGPRRRDALRALAKGSGRLVGGGRRQRSEILSIDSGPSRLADNRTLNTWRRRGGPQDRS